MSNGSYERVGLFYAYSNTTIVNTPNSARLVISVANANDTSTNLTQEDF